MSTPPITSPRSKSPARVAAGKRNRELRGTVTPQGSQRLADHARHYRPWQYSTGPRTTAGKAKSSDNGRWRQAGPTSVRQVIREQAPMRAIKAEIKKLIRQLEARHGGEC